MIKSTILQSNLLIKFSWDASLAVADTLVKCHSKSLYNTPSELLIGTKSHFENWPPRLFKMLSLKMEILDLEQIIFTMYPKL